jgi:hypothetical protein
VFGLCSTVCVCLGGCAHVGVCNARQLVQHVLTRTLFFIPSGRLQIMQTLVYACRACTCMW